MSDLVTKPARPGAFTGTVVGLRDLAPWAILLGALMLLAVYLVGAEGGATSLVSGPGVHEFVHDARHLLGFPCH